MESAVASINQFSGRLNDRNGLVNELLTDYGAVSQPAGNRCPNPGIGSFFYHHHEQRAGRKYGAAGKRWHLGMLLHDEGVATDLKTTISNLKSGSQKLDENMQALQHNFLLRGYFKRKQPSNPQ